MQQLIQWSGPSVRILGSKSGPVRVGPVRELDTTQFMALEKEYPTVLEVYQCYHGYV